MFIRSLFICSFLMGVVFAGNIGKMKKDLSSPLEDTGISSKPIDDDQIVKDLDLLKAQYLDIRKKYDAWMADPFHRNVVAPAAVGALAAFLTMILLSIIYCCCKRFISKRFGYRKLNESGTGWFGRRNTSHDS